MNESSKPLGELLAPDLPDDRQQVVTTFVSATVTGQIELCSIHPTTKA